MLFESAIHRAAVLIKSLPQPQASRLLAKLDSNDLQTVFKKIRTLTNVSEPQRLSAIQKFLEASTALASKPAKSNRRKSGESPGSGPFDFLTEVSAEIRFRILVGEHPKVVASVLSFLPTKMAATTLNSLEPETRITVLRRLCQLDEFDSQEIANISYQLKSRLNRLLNSDRCRQGGFRVATKLLSCTDSATRESLIEYLDQQDPELARDLKQQVLRFECLSQFSDADIRTILKWVDTSVWAPALKNAATPVRTKILKNMSERPREILNREIQNINALAPHFSAEAQTHVIDTCIRLAERQQIRLPSDRPVAEHAETN